MEKKVVYDQQNVAEFLKESNAIEGVYGQEPLADSHIAWDYIQRHDVLTLDIILECHRIIMSRLSPSIAGKIRTQDVFVGSREGYPPSVVEKALTKWLGDANQKPKENCDACNEKMVKKTHVWFEYIHPFADGNGRTGRLIMLWQRQKCSLPMEIIYEKEKHQNYYRWFRDPDMEVLYTYKFVDYEEKT